MKVFARPPAHPPDTKLITTDEFLCNSLPIHDDYDVRRKKIIYMLTKRSTEQRKYIFTYVFHGQVP